MAIQSPDSRTLADLASLSPPADPNVEATVLQACALHPAWFRRNVAALHASAFTHPGYRVIYEHMQDALVSEQPLDVVTLTGRLREAGQLDVAGGLAGPPDGEGLRGLDQEPGGRMDPPGSRGRREAVYGRLQGLRDRRPKASRPRSTGRASAGSSLASRRG